MTEADWLKGKGAGAMLAAVGESLGPRRWRLLACALARRAWDALPDGPLREVVEWAELLPKDAAPAAQVKAWRKKLAPAGDEALAHAVAEMRAIVKEADPDSAPAHIDDTDLGPPIPSQPLFTAASWYALHAVTQAEETARLAAAAVVHLLDAPVEESYALQKAGLLDALTRRQAANQAAANARKLKAQGDEFADNYNARTARVDFARARGIVTRLQEAAGDAGFDAEDRVRKGVSRYEARVLHDLVANPFAPPRFDPKWRTSTVVAIAEGIYADRAFDRLPILADALLDADCDEEAVLRHCRGTEAHGKNFKEAQPHVRGCWVVECVLNRWSPPKVSAAPPRRPPRDFDDFPFPPLGDDDDSAYA